MSELCLKTGTVDGCAGESGAESSEDEEKNAKDDPDDPDDHDGHDEAEEDETDGAGSGAQNNHSDSTDRRTEDKSLESDVEEDLASVGDISDEDNVDAAGDCAEDDDADSADGDTEKYEVDAARSSVEEERVNAADKNAGEGDANDDENHAADAEYAEGHNAGEAQHKTLGKIPHVMLRISADADAQGEEDMECRRCCHRVEEQVEHLRCSQCASLFHLACLREGVHGTNIDACFSSKFKCVSSEGG